MEKKLIKKRKAEVDEEADEDKAKKQKVFCAETFRKELNKLNLVASLKEFLNLAQQEKNEYIVTEYLEAGGSVQEMLLLLDESAKSDLTSALPVFKVLHLLFLSVKDKDSKFYAQAEHGAKFMLDSFIPTIEAMMNINSSKHRRAVLKVLTSIVTLFPYYGREIMNIIPSSPLVLSQFLQTQSGPDSVRKWFIFFILSFIISGDIGLIRTLMSMKGLLSDIMLNLKTDEADTISMFLSVVKQKILENIRISKTLKLKVFYTQVIVSLFELYNWKDAKAANLHMLTKKKALKPKVVVAEEKELVTESVHDFLLVLCTSKKLGIAFADNSFGTVGEAKNNLLSSVIQAIPDFWVSKRMSEAVIAIVVSCPDVMGATLARTDAIIQPRESEMWIKLMQFILRLLEAVSPKDILTAAEQVPEIDLVRLAKKFCTPSKLIRSMGAGIRKNDCFSVLYYSLKVLTLLWRKTMEVVSAHEGNEKLKTALLGAYTACIMKVDEVLIIWEGVCKMPKQYESVERVEFLNLILEYLDMCSKIQKNVVESPGRIAVNILNAIDEIRESLGEESYLSIQSRVFYLLIAADPESVTPDTDLFKRAITLLLRDNSTGSIKTVATMVLSTGVFGYNESEIDIWFGCYFERFQQYEHSVPEAFAECISRLYLKKSDSERNFVKCSAEKPKCSSELANTSAVTKGKPVSGLTDSPVLKQLLKMLKDKEEMKDLREALTKFCAKYKEKVAEEVLQYVQEGDVMQFVADGSVFLMKVEKTLMTWLAKKKKRLELESVLNMETTDNMSLFLLFNTMTSYLTARVSSDSLSEGDETKLRRLVSVFMSFGSGKTVQTSPCILSHDVKDPSRLRMKCMQCLFSIPLLDKFDVYEYENETIVNFTKIMTGALMTVTREDLKGLTVFQPWKRKVLDRIKTNLRDKDKTRKIFEGLEPVLDRFTFNSAEVSGVLREYGNMADLKTFVDGGQLTMSTMIMIKFLKFQCEFPETNGKCVKKLRMIMKSMAEAGGEDLEVLDECFEYLLKSKPKALSLFPNDFVEDLLRRSDSNENMIALCKLLLNDPAKVNHFVKYATKNFKDLKNQKAIVVMASVVVIGRADSFLEFLRSRKFCRFWTESELMGKEQADVSQLLELIYKKYRKCIRGEKKTQAEFILQHQRFFAVLSKCFLDGESLTGMKSNILEASFLPEIIHETVLKHKDEEDVVETYTTGLLTMCSEELKKVEDGACDEEAWSRFGKCMCDVANLGKQSSWSVITDGAMWKDFVRLSLRVCFNFPTCPSFLKTIRHFVEVLYPPEGKHQDVKKIFDMLISHSKFLNVMLQESRLKCELVKLYYSLIKRNSDVLSGKHIPVILASYAGSLSENDVTLLNILRFYEMHDLNMNEYEPVVWGEPAITHYSVKTNVGISLWRRITMYNVLEVLDGKRMEASLEDFPVTRTGMTEECVAYNDKVYDPAFLLPIFTNLLSPGAVTYCLPFVQKGCFAYVIRALSSTSKDIRISASVVLARFYNHLELVQMMKLKPVWLHFINCLRYAIEDIASKPVPSVVTYFLGKTSLELSGEPGDMYTSLQKFLLAKPVFNFDYIPEFLPLFHSSDVNYMKHRRWILEVMRDGFKQNNDLDLLFQTMAIKIILSYFRSQFCTRELKPLVLEVVTNVLNIDKSKFLISEYGLLTWLNGVSLTCEKELFPPFMKLLSAAAALTFKTKLSKNVFYPIQLLNILMKVLPNLGDCRSTAVIESYLAILLQCLLMLLRLKHLTWCKVNRSKLQDLSDVIASVSGQRRLAEKYVKSKFFFSFCDVPNEIENSYRKIAFVWNVSSGLL